jgi:alkanesulfonate monooxygenase SsuD/methylene tetrahydromethanopterin reductase-like flavin-dependent oxidoreductase (luciferase family)
MVVASAMTTLYDLSGGRACYALGTGGSATAGMGMTALTQQQCREHMLALRDLFAGHSTVWQGRTIPALRFPRPVPIYYSAKGPKAMALAGSVADGVILQVGMSLEETARKIEAVRDAAEAAGRDRTSIDVWAFSFTAVRDRREDALADIKALLAATGAYTMNQNSFRDAVPLRFRSALAELRERYMVADHGVVGGRNEPLIDELGLADYLAEIVAVAGTRFEVSKVLGGLEELGVTHFLCALPGNADPIGNLQRMKDAFDTRMGPTTSS